MPREQSPIPSPQNWQLTRIATLSHRQKGWASCPRFRHIDQPWGVRGRRRPGNYFLICLSAAFARSASWDGLESSGQSSCGDAVDPSPSRSSEPFVSTLRWNSLRELHMSLPKDATSRVADDRRVWGPDLTVLLVAATLAMLALCGESTAWGMILFILTFLGVHAFGWKRKSWQHSPGMQRLAIAFCLGFSALWFGMELNTVKYRDLSPEARQAWEKQYDFPPEPSGRETCIVAGFPIRQVQGHDYYYYAASFWAARGNPLAGKGHNSSRIPMDKGLVVLWLNFAVLTFCGYLATLGIPSKVLGWAHAGTFVVTCYCVWVALHCLAGIAYT